MFSLFLNCFRIKQYIFNHDVCNDPEYNSNALESTQNMLVIMAMSFAQTSKHHEFPSENVKI